jgi:hypothetical protein
VKPTATDLKTLLHSWSHTLRNKKFELGSISALAGFDPDALGKTLGRLDVKWYQRHFGVRDLPDSTLPTPRRTPSAQQELTKER